jgi:uncharacterized damage-inducible protein DinB
MKKYFIKQFEFELWANRILAETIEKSTEPDPRVLLLFSHLLNSYNMWFSRLNNTEFETKIFDERSLANNIVFMNSTFNNWLKFLNVIDEEKFNEQFSFVFPIDGSKRNIKIEDAISHLITHSNYHRGQIIALLNPP